MANKTLFFFLSHLFLFSHIHNVALEGADWRLDHDIEAASLCAQIQDALSKAQSGTFDTKILETLRLKLTRAAVLLGEDDFEKSYTKTLERNFQACQLPFNAPAHICLGLKLEELSADTVQKAFTEIETFFIEVEKNPYNPINATLQAKLISIYNSLHHEKTLPENDLNDYETTIKKLESEDIQIFLEPAKKLMSCIRQAHHTLQLSSDINLWLAHTNSTLSEEIAAQKKAFLDLGIDAEFALNLLEACTNAKGKIASDNLNTLLNDPRLKPQEPPATSVLNWLYHGAYATTKWFTSTNSATSDNPPSPEYFNYIEF